MGYYDDYSDGYEDQSINFSDYGFKPGPGGYQKEDMSIFPDQPDDMSIFPDQPTPKKYETYTSPGTTVTPGAEPSMWDKISNAWESLKNVESPVPTLPSLGAMSRATGEFGSRVGEFAKGQGQFGGTLFKSQIMHDPLASAELAQGMAEPFIQAYSPEEQEKYGNDFFGRMKRGARLGSRLLMMDPNAIEADWAAGNVGGLAGDIIPPLAMGAALHKIGGEPTLPREINPQGNLRFDRPFERNDFGGTDRPSPFTVKEPESPIVQRAKAMSEIDQIAEQQILELKMEQSQATQIGDHAKATKLANDILQVEMDASVQKRNWIPPPESPAPEFPYMSQMGQGELNFSSYRGPGGKFMGVPSPEMRRGVLGPPIAEMPTPASGGASIPFMITREMEAKLVQLGLSPEVINKLTPQQANDMINMAPPSTPSITETQPAGATQIRPEEPPLVEPPDVPIGPTSDQPTRVEIRPGTSDAALWRSRGYGPVADTNARINKNPVWEFKGSTESTPVGTPFERAMRAKARSSPVPEGRVVHRPGQDIVIPNEHLDKAAPNLEAQGYKIVEGSDNGTTTTFRQDQSLLNRLIKDPSGEYDPKQLWDNLKRLFGRDPTPAEIESATSRQVQPGEVTGRTANFPSNAANLYEVTKAIREGTGNVDALMERAQALINNYKTSSQARTDYIEVQRLSDIAQDPSIADLFQSIADSIKEKGNELDAAETAASRPTFINQRTGRQSTEPPPVPPENSFVWVNGKLVSKSELVPHERVKTREHDFGPSEQHGAKGTDFSQSPYGPETPSTQEFPDNPNAPVVSFKNSGIPLNDPRHPLNQPVTGPKRVEPTDVANVPEQPSLPGTTGPMRVQNQLERISNAKPEQIDLGPQPTQESLMSRFIKDEEGTFDPRELLRNVRRLFSRGTAEVSGSDLASRVDRQLGPDNTALQGILEQTRPNRLREDIQYWTRMADREAQSGNDFTEALTRRYVEIARARLQELESGHTPPSSTAAVSGQGDIEIFYPSSGAVVARVNTIAEARDFIAQHVHRRSLDYEYVNQGHIPSVEPPVEPSAEPVPSRANPAIHSPQEMQVLNAQTVPELRKIIQDLANRYPDMIGTEAGIDLLDMANVRNTELGGTTPIETPTRPVVDISTVPEKARIPKRPAPLVPEPYNPYRDFTPTGQMKERQAVRYGGPRGEYRIKDYGRTQPIQAEEGPLPREPLLPFEEELNPRAISEDMTSPEATKEPSKGKLIGRPGITKEQYQELVGSTDRYSLGRDIKSEDYDWGDSFGRSVARNSGDGPPGLRVQRDAGSPNEGRIVFRNADGRPLAAARFSEKGISALGADPDMGVAGKMAAVRVLEHAANTGVMKVNSSISPFTANLIRQAKRLILDDTGAIPLDDFFDAFRKVRDNATGVWKWLTESPGKVEGQRIPSRFEKAIGLPTALTTTLDLSMPFRQGFMKIFTPEWRAAWKPMLQAAWSPELARRIDAQIRELPAFQETRDPITQKIYKSFGETEGGVRLIKPGELYRSEADVAGNYAEQIPFAGRPIRASNRAAATFLNHMRANTFQNLADAGRAMSMEALTKERAPYPGIMGGVQLPEMMGGGRLGFTKKYTVEAAENLNPYKNLILARKIGNYVNTATGRGSLGALEPAARVLSHALFSPRGLAARVQMLSPHTYIMANPFVRKQYLKSALGGAAAWYTMAQLAKGAGAISGVDVNVNTDWNSSDVGKIRIGNFRLDPAAGFQQMLVLYHRLITGGWTSSETGKKNTFGKGFRAETAGSTTQRFFMNKLAPIAKFGTDMLFATEHVPVHVADRTMQMFVPLFAQDLWELSQEDPKLLLGAGPLAGLGMGSQVYEKGESISKFIPAKRDYLYKGDPKKLMPWNWNFSGGR